MIIEQATAADLACVLDLTMEHARLNEGFDRQYYSLADDAEADYRESLRQSLRDQSQRVLVARVDEEIVGCIQADFRKILIFRRSERGFIYNLYVQRMWRRRGIGRHLMEKAIDWLQTSGAEMIFLNVAGGNDEAQRFYERLGFKTVNTNMYKLI